MWLYKKKLLILIYTLWKKNEPFKDLSHGMSNRENEMFHESEIGIKKRRFPAKGREPQGQPPSELLAAFQVE